MTSYCQYTPDKKEQSTQNQTKICAIIVFYVYFVLYIELLFGDVGLNGSLNNIKKGGWLEHGKAISFNIYDNTSYFLFLNSAGNVYASVLSTVYDFHNTIIKNDFNDNDIEISYDHNTKAVIVKNNGNLIIDCRCI